MGIRKTLATTIHKGERTVKKIINRAARMYYGSLFKSAGRKVRFFPFSSDIHYWNISAGDDVYIGPSARFICGVEGICIGNKVIMGPGVTIITGEHPIDPRGRYICDIREKKPGEDQAVHIGDDVWIGAGATILKGVEIGRGAIVAAGALVKNNIPPYAIAGGVPAKIIRYRGSKETLLAHEEQLYGKVLTDFKSIMPENQNA